MHCNVILDLIPLVKDGVASDESASIVNEHVDHCKSCKSELETFEIIKIDPVQMESKKIIFDIKRSIFMTQIVILVVGAAIGIALSNSMGMFYNFIIMPIVGAISLIAFKKKWYVAPLAIFLITYSWQTLLFMMENGFSLVGLSVGLYFSVVYTILVALGAVIAVLLRFAFEKGDKNEK
jgi:hypothetical protein